MKADGTIDSLEYKIVKEIGAWLKVNGESIYGTRPWTLFGEGPAIETKNPMKDQGFNEGKIHYTAKDIRYVRKGRTVYATTLAVPAAGSMVTLKAIKKARKVSLLGYGVVAFHSTDKGLQIQVPAQLPNDIALVFKIM